MAKYNFCVFIACFSLKSHISEISPLFEKEITRKQMNYNTAVLLSNGLFDLPKQGMNKVVKLTNESS